MKPVRGRSDKPRIRRERDERRASALRENLQKRKAQARARAGGPPRPTDQPPGR